MREFRVELKLSLGKRGRLGVFVEITQDWLVVLNTSIENLDKDVIDSSIVDEEYIIKGLAVITYVF